MIIPSIDLMNGNAVQLVGGEKMALDAGDPMPIADVFGRVAEVAVIDLDAALAQGNNASVIQQLLKRCRCRVGGGIRTAEQALALLDAGAAKVILGTAARPDILRQLPKDRVIVALDAKHGEVVVEGWKTRTGKRIEDRMAELQGLAGGFLVTFVEREGRLEGIDLDAVARLKALAGDADLCVAGGVTTPEDVAAIDQLGVDCQVGMALYTGRFDLASALIAVAKSDREDGLIATVVTDEQGVALGLAWSNEESLRAAIQSGRGTYHSRRRGLWVKGESSDATQALLRIDFDCDRDALRFMVAQRDPGFCHKSTTTCWGSGHRY